MLPVDKSCIGLQGSRSLCVPVQDFCRPASLKPVEPYDKRRNLRLNVGEEA